MDNLLEPKSKHFPFGVQKTFTDCSSFPSVDFSKFDFPIKIIETSMDARIEKEVFSAIKRVGVIVDKEELLRALEYERNQYAKGYIAGFEAAQAKWRSETMFTEHDHKMDFDDGYVEGHKNGFDAGLQVARSKWIGVEERLPEPGKWVLAYCGSYANWFVLNKWCGTEWLYVMPVTHWMPLPPCPEEVHEA